MPDLRPSVTGETKLQDCLDQLAVLQRYRSPDVTHCFGDYLVERVTNARKAQGYAVRALDVHQYVVAPVPAQLDDIRVDTF